MFLATTPVHVDTSYEQACLSENNWHRIKLASFAVAAVSLLATTTFALFSAPVILTVFTASVIPLAIGFGIYALYRQSLNIEKIIELNDIRSSIDKHQPNSSHAAQDPNSVVLNLKFNDENLSRAKLCLNASDKYRAFRTESMFEGEFVYGVVYWNVHGEIDNETNKNKEVIYAKIRSIS